MSRITDRKESLQTLKEIEKNKKDYLVIHYASESFYNLEGKSPRITSIAVHNPKYGQSELFAIYKSAEKMGIEFSNIIAEYSKIEKSMLEVLTSSRNRHFLPISFPTSMNIELHLINDFGATLVNT